MTLSIRRCPFEDARLGPCSDQRRPREAGAGHAPWGRRPAKCHPVHAARIVFSRSAGDGRGEPRPATPPLIQSQRSAPTSNGLVTPTDSRSHNLPARSAARARFGVSAFGLTTVRSQRGAGVAKLVNAETSHVSGRKPLRVRVPPPAPPLAPDVGPAYNAARAKSPRSRFATPNESRGASSSPAFLLPPSRSTPGPSAPSQGAYSANPRSVQPRSAAPVIGEDVVSRPHHRVARESTLGVRPRSGRGAGQGGPQEGRNEAMTRQVDERD